MPIAEDYQLELNGLVIGPNTDYELVSIDGLENLPDVRTYDRERALRHGFFSTRDLYGKRVITIELEVWGDSGTAQFRDAVTALGNATADPDTDIVVTGRLPGYPLGDLRVTGRVRRRSIPLDQRYALGVATAFVQLECFDPRVYSATLHSMQTGVSTSAGGLSFPLEFPLDFGGTGDSGTVQIENLGNFDAPWTAVITGPISNPQIENQTTGSVLRFAISLGPGDTLELSSDFHRALLNGITSRYDTITADSEWWDFPPGVTPIRFTGVTAGSPTLTVSWRDARI